MSATTRKEMDMTHGPIFKNLLMIALPLALSGILQLLFNAADLIVIGQLSSTPEESLAAVSSNGSLYTLIINLAMGLSVGANVIMAQSIGARNATRARKTLHTSLLLSVIVGVILGVTGFVLARPLLVLMNTDPIILDKAVLYLQIVFLGFPASSVYNFGAALLRAKGDTRRPLVFLSIAGVCNVALNVVLVLLGFDVAGAAIATAASHFISAILLIITLFHENGYCQLTLKHLKISAKELGDIIRVGLPSGLLSSSFSFANVIIQSAVNGFGYLVVAGNSTGANLEGFAYTALNSVSQAVLPYVAQNYGAGKHQRIPKVIFNATVLVFLAWIIVDGLIILFREPLASLYVNDPSSPEGQQIVYYASVRLIAILPVQFLCGFMDIILNTLRSMNRVIIPMIVNLLFVCVFRILWVYCVFPIPQMHTLSGLFLTWPISWTFIIIIESVHFILVYRKLISQPLRKTETGEGNDFYSSETVEPTLFETATTLDEQPSDAQIVEETEQNSENAGILAEEKE